MMIAHAKNSRILRFVERGAPMPNNYHIAEGLSSVMSGIFPFSQKIIGQFGKIDRNLLTSDFSDRQAGLLNLFARKGLRSVLPRRFLTAWRSCNGSAPVGADPLTHSGKDGIS
jgi:hypothetical protein